MLRWGSLTSVDPPSDIRGAGRTAIVRSGQVQRDLVRACIKSPCGAPSWKAALEGGRGVCTVAPRGSTRGRPPPRSRGEGRRRMADVAYCMKCREKREFTGSLVTLKNGRPALQGSCPVCGTKLTKILGMDAAKAMGWTG